MFSHNIQHGGGRKRRANETLQSIGKRRRVSESSSQAEAIPGPSNCDAVAVADTVQCEVCNIIVKKSRCSKRGVWVSAVLATLLAGALVAVLVLQPWSPNPLPRYPRGAVGANGYECASVGREILEKNGSAVDAAIATLFCEGLGCAQCMGLGGGFLATVYDAATGTVRVLNARERAPAAATENMFENASSTVGGLAVAVPGELRGYGALYKEYGRLPWPELVRPTADLCRRGHRVTPYMARVLNQYSERIMAEPSMREIYVNPATGKVWGEGDLIKEPTLARTLDIIAEGGPEEIHNGSLTAALVSDIREFGGIITEDDLRNFRVEWLDPIAVPLAGGKTLYSSPLPGSGCVLAFILNVLQGWVGPGTNAPVDSALYWHRIIETFKYAYAKRTGLGDVSRSNLPYSIRQLQEDMSNRTWAEGFRKLINDAHTYNDWKHYGAMFETPEDHGTAHVIVVAPDGSVVSVTSTVNYIWGSQRRSKKLGIILNNEMDDFAVPNRENAYKMPPSPANMVAPGLQPLSSMVPSIVLDKDNKLSLVIGAAGGTKITTQVALTLLNVMLEGGDLDEAIQRPRIHHQLIPMEVEHEVEFSQTILKALKDRGHAITEQLGGGFAAMVAAIRGKDGLLMPVTDHRRVGSTDGL